MEDTIPDVSVLCVDDDAELVSLLAGGLERESDRLDVTTATNVDAALETYRRTDVDCIVSDYHMPARTGVELLEVVRADDPKLPFVMYTRTGSEAVASESIRAGVTDYVVRRATDEQYGLLTERILTHVDERRSERRASRTNRTLRALSAAADEVLFMFSADWSELQFINDAYETVFGGSVDRLRAAPRSFLTHVYSEDVDRVTDAMERVSGGHPQQMEYRVDRSADIRIWVESRCKPVRNGSGDVEAVAGFTREVTERKHREQELEDRNETLDRFAATVAHDLRNPLAVADAKLKLARAETDSEHIDDGIEAVDRMSRLIDELLAPTPPAPSRTPHGSPATPRGSGRCSRTSSATPSITPAAPSTSPSGCWTTASTSRTTAPASPPTSGIRSSSTPIRPPPTAPASDCSSPNRSSTHTAGPSRPSPVPTAAPGSRSPASTSRPDPSHGAVASGPNRRREKRYRSAVQMTRFWR
ncbi:hypothetical protein BRD05_00280 [Halobacteriales archaeon QS_9_70_65]|nr:MAG: hypothetical protein BRD05_00280 [Halobacteriales archaeon QS_9_70_65]